MEVSRYSVAEVPKRSGEEVQKLIGSHACDVQLKQHILNLPEFQTVLRTYASCLTIGASPEFLAAVDGFDPVAALHLKYTSGCWMNQPSSANGLNHTDVNQAKLTTADQQKHRSAAADRCGGESSQEEGPNSTVSGDGRSEALISISRGANGLGAVGVDAGLESALHSLAGAHDLMASLSEALVACRTRLLAAHTTAEVFLVDVENSHLQDADAAATGDADAAGGDADATDAAAGDAVPDAGGVDAAVADAANHGICNSSSGSGSSSDGDGAFTSSAIGSRGSGGFLEGDQDDMYDDIMADISTSPTLATHSQEHHRLGSHAKTEAGSSALSAGNWEMEQIQHTFQSAQGSPKGAGGMGQIQQGFDAGQGNRGPNLDWDLEGKGEEEEIESVEQVERAVRGRFGGFLRTVSAEHVAKHAKGKLPEEATGKLLRWWTEHVTWPYPTEQEKLQLMGQTGLDSRQVNNWFINQRKRHWNQHSKRQRKGV
ncbi:unnamed protein product [Closterium sp. Naga37s-1]|nr:unnamed protein product [Closterium sp. Naga37s-1]